MHTKKAKELYEKLKPHTSRVHWITTIGNREVSVKFKAETSEEEIRQSIEKVCIKMRKPYVIAYIKKNRCLRSGQETISVRLI